MPQLQAPSLTVTDEVAAATKALLPAVKRITKSLNNLDASKLPIGSLADLLYELRQLGKVLGSLTTPFEDILPDTIKTVEEFFIQKLAVGESSGVQGRKSRVQITEQIIPVIQDWPKFYAHIKKTGEFELLNRAVNRASVTERWDAKKQVPGVGKFHSKRVSCTKLSGK